LRALEEKLEPQQEQFSLLKTMDDKLIVLKVLQERHLAETAPLASNQLRINKKINYSIIALAIIGCLAAVQMGLSLLN
jgi:hypothetical protein